MLASASTDVVWLLYDGECPICRTYCSYARIREAVGELRLVDARQPGPLRNEITAAGLDVDQGIVLKFKGVVYFGPDAMHMLTLLGTRSGWFNRIAFALFGTRLGSRIVYPACKALRNLLLKLLGIEFIDNLGQAPSPPLDAGSCEESHLASHGTRKPTWIANDKSQGGTPSQPGEKPRGGPRVRSLP
jgi:predicted DCC family thiol-disulfide oxidoreductase YuxK